MNPHESESVGCNLRKEMVRVAIICPDVSSNALGRAYVLGRMLQPMYEVEILGIGLGDAIWKPLRDEKEIPIRHIRATRGLLTYIGLFRLWSQLEADVLYASKPLVSSFVVALAKRGRCPVILDIDDWEFGFVKSRFAELPRWKRVIRILRSSPFLYRPGNPIGVWISEKLIPLATKVTVSNNFLLSRYGGTTIPHGRDAMLATRVTSDPDEIRERYSIDASTTVIGFVGTPHKHKGGEDLVDAVAQLTDISVILLVVGLDTTNDYCAGLKVRATRVLGNRFIGIGQMPFSALTSILDAVDIIVIPQRREPATDGQFPVKTLDAMARQKVIVATKVVVLTEILQGCAWFSEPNDPTSLGEAIRSALADPREARRRAEEARRRFLQQYTWQVLGERLCNVIGTK